MLHPGLPRQGAARRSRTESLVLPPAVQPPARHLGTRSGAARTERRAYGADDPPRVDPSSEPIADEEREIRLQNSANSIGRLALSAKEIGAVLCIENLPRTCLGRDSGELMRLIADYPEVMVCFDSNHLLKEEHAHFFEAVGNRIGTIHASDYDRKDERHWLPGEGVIDWPDFLRRLQASGYKGVFMHEVRAGVNATPENVVKAYKEVILGKMKK